VVELIEAESGAYDTPCDGAALSVALRDLPSRSSLIQPSHSSAAGGPNSGRVAAMACMSALLSSEIGRGPAGRPMPIYSRNRWTMPSGEGLTFAMSFFGSNVANGSSSNFEISELTSFGSTSGLR